MSFRVKLQVLLQIYYSSVSCSAGMLAEVLKIARRILAIR